MFFLKFSRFLERTSTYLANGYRPWWILGRNCIRNANGHFWQKPAVVIRQLVFCLWLIDTQNQSLMKLEQINWYYQEGVSSQQSDARKGRLTIKKHFALCAKDKDQTITVLLSGLLQTIRWVDTKTAKEPAKNPCDPRNIVSVKRQCLPAAYVVLLCKQLWHFI